MLMPENFFSILKNKIQKEWLWAFFSAFVIGFFTHLYRFTNFLHNWDSILNLHADQNNIFQGRSFLTYSCGISSFYDLPVVNGLLSLIFLSLCSVCVIELFSIRKKLSIILTAGIIVTFPTVAATLSYSYLADGFLLAMLLAAASVLITDKYKYGFLGGAVCLCISYGTYQAYIAFAITLILVRTFYAVFFEMLSTKEILKKLFRFLLMGVLGTALYFITLQIMLKIQGVSLSSYQGIADMGFSLETIKNAFPSCLRQFRHFYLGDMQPSLYTVLNIVILLWSVILTIAAFFRRKIYKNIANTVIAVVAAFAVPFGACVVYFVSPGVEYHTLMCCSFLLIILLPVFYYDFWKPKSGWIIPSASWLTVAVLALTAYNNALIANIGYQHMQTSYERTYGLMVQVADRISQAANPKSLTQIGVIGFLNDDYIMLNLPPEMTGMTPSYFIDGQYGMRTMLNDYFEFSLTDVSDDILIPFVHSEEYKQMECWPSEKSVYIKDNIVYLKLNDVEW